MGRGNANLLSESLTYAKPEDLQSNDIIQVSTGAYMYVERALTVTPYQELYTRCRLSQEFISAQMPSAFSRAEKSRQASMKTETMSREGWRSSERERGESDERECASSSSKDKGDSGHLTTEEKLLAAILAANEELLGALRQYGRLERVGIERDAQE